MFNFAKRRFVTGILIVFVLAPIFPIPVAQAESITVYSDKFESERDRSMWSHPILDRTPSGRGFLGRFSSETNTLTLESLVAHGSIDVAFKLYVIQTWDGSIGNQAGPPADIFDVTVQDGPNLLHTTFANCKDNHSQAYPDSYPTGLNDPMTDAIERNTLGYTPDCDREGTKDSVYDLELRFDHTESSVAIQFGGQNLQGVGDESWGLDDIEVTLNRLPPNAPTLDSPADGATGISVETAVMWTNHGDPNGLSVSDTVYLDSFDPPATPYCSDTTSTTCNSFVPLMNGTTYWWKVRTTNSLGLSSESPVWSFTTFGPPETPTVSCTPSELRRGQSTACTATSTDAQGREIYYTFDWGDGSPPTRAPADGTVPSGTSQVASHTFPTTPVCDPSVTHYVVSVTATNTLGDRSDAGTATVDQHNDCNDGDRTLVLLKRNLEP